MAVMPRLGLMIAVPLILLTPLAHAAGKEANERAARKACLSGDYAKGVEILSDLFIDTKDANYIFNQARCFEQNNRCEEAVSRFREYLRKATSLAPEDKADTEKHITDCQALLGQKTAPEPKVAVAPPAPAPAAPIVVPSPAPAVAPPVAPAPAQLDVASATPPAANPGHGLRIAGIACGAVGAASVGAGIYYYTQAKSYSDKVSNQTGWGWQLPRRLGRLSRQRDRQRRCLFRYHHRLHLQQPGRPDLRGDDARIQGCQQLQAMVQ
jgi:hypothetical protein